MAKKARYTADEVVKAVRGSGGFVSLIAERLKVNVQTVYNYRDQYASVRLALNEEREKMIDQAEGALQRQIKADNITAIIFYLKTQAKQRGYVERQEVTGGSGGPIVVKWANEVE
jgi:hypothetical protein